MLSDAERPDLPEGGLWNRSRLDLLRALTRSDATSGELYKTAIDTLGQQPLTRAKFMIIGHCFREIANSLPVMLADVEIPKRANESGPAAKLSKVWEKHAPSSADVPLLANEPSDSVPDKKVAVSVRLLEAARNVVVMHRVAHNNSRLRHSALVLGRLEHGRDASLDLFQISYAFFMAQTHHDRTQEPTLPSPDDVSRHLDVIEAALRGRVDNFFTTAEELKDVLAAANRRREQP